MKKLFRLLIVSVLTLSVVFSTIGCGGGNSKSDSPDTLDIYLLYKGYQDEWLTTNIALFKQQQWVKDKYPNLTVNYDYDGTDATASSKISQGASLNKFDLIFSVNMDGYDGTGLVMDLTDALYLSEVPGEPGVKVIDKIPDERLDTFASTTAPVRSDGYETYYTACYIDGIFGWLCNYDALDAMGKQEPVTTEEFFKLLEEIKTTGYTLEGKSNSKTGIISTDSGYQQSLFNLWWAQYESVEEYKNFFKGYDSESETSLSSEVVKQKGRLRSLEVLDELFFNYRYKDAASTKYNIGQAEFLDGKGVFHYNGDYFASEMRNTYDLLVKEGTDYDIRYMKAPVISSIVEKLDLYKDGNTSYNALSQDKQNEYDAILSSVIRDIDAGKDYENLTADISENDFEVIYNARKTAAFNTGNTQTIAIPDYSPAKELAVDFMRFMYTDTAIAAAAKASRGIRFAAKYDYKADQETYSAFSRISKSSYEIITEKDYQIIPNPESFRLGKAGLGACTSFNGKFEVMFARQDDERMTALDIYNEEIEYWNVANWGQMLARAGYAGNA